MNNCRLADVCLKITDGAHFSPQGISEGYPMLSVKDMSDYGFSYASCKYISKEDYEKMLKNGCVPKKNDVLIAKDGSYLKHVFIVSNDREQAILSSIGILRPNLEKVTPQFIKYYLSLPSIKEQVARKYVTGTALPRIILKNFSDIAIPLIDIDNQKNITYLLEKLDSKIENNTKQIEVLESLAKTIYDYWFVQFDFPNEDGKPYKSSGGKMVWNEELKREIPEGWGCSSLEDQLLILKDGTHNPPKRINEGIPLLTGNIFGDFFINKENATYISKEDYQKIHSQYHPIEGDLILTKIGTIGGVNYLRDEDLPLAIHCNSALLRYKNSFGKYFPLFLMKSEIFQNRLRAMKGQSVQEFVSLSRLGSILIEVPMTNVISAFNSRIESIMKNIEKVYSENEHLISLRKFLLPLLMNGQVTISNHT